MTILKNILIISEDIDLGEEVAERYASKDVYKPYSVFTTKTSMNTMREYLAHNKQFAGVIFVSSDEEDLKIDQIKNICGDWSHKWTLT